MEEVMFHADRLMMGIWGAVVVSSILLACLGVIYAMLKWPKLAYVIVALGVLTVMYILGAVIIEIGGSLPWAK